MSNVGLWALTYDISVKTQAGKRRARKVRVLAQEVGWSVQKSIFIFHSRSEDAKKLLDRIINVIDVCTDRVAIMRIAHLWQAGDAANGNEVSRDFYIA